MVSLTSLFSNNFLFLVKILQGLMTVGFKTDSSNDSRYLNSLGKNSKIMKMDISRIDDVQEIEF
jgi:hypothetical protein